VYICVANGSTVIENESLELGIISYLRNGNGLQTYLQIPYQILYIAVDNYKRGDCVKIYGYVRKN
jgi:hypothetical protein